MQIKILVGALLSVLVSHSPASSQNYPVRPVTILSNFPPAGGVDIVGRIAGAELQKRLGQSFVVENKPGATGMIGAIYVAKSKPDGYTILVTSNPPMIMLPYMTKANYDPVKDFIPIAKVGIAPTVIVVPENSPYKTLKDLIEAGKNDANKITVGVTGLGSSPHIEFALLNKMTGSKIEMIPYRGANFIATDVLGDQITIGTAAVPAFAGHIRAGKMKPLAVVSKSRSSILPEVPTVREALNLPLDGFPTWYGFYVPRETSKEIVSRLETEILAIMNEPAVIDRMREIGIEVLAVSSIKFAAENEAETEALKRAIKETNITITIQ